VKVQAVTLLIGSVAGPEEYLIPGIATGSDSLAVFGEFDVIGGDGTGIVAGLDDIGISADLKG
jgi:hypothetical protein